MKIIGEELFYFNQEKLTLDFPITPSSLFMGIIFNPALFWLPITQMTLLLVTKTPKTTNKLPFSNILSFFETQKCSNWFPSLQHNT